MRFFPAEDQEKWREILKSYVNIPEIIIPRFCLPEKRAEKGKIRLICLADAAEFAGGAVVYAGVETSPGTWSCSLLAAKSKLMKETIPRNELSAILLCAELAFMVKSSLGSKVGEVIYLTDSTIALSWCSSETIKLRLFVYNRVMTILRLVEWTTGSTEEALFHIDGSQNLADLLTKEHEIGMETVSKGSCWIEGLPWMKKDKKDMPITSYKEFKLDKKTADKVQQECFPESFLKEFSTNSGEVQEVGPDGDEQPLALAALAARAGRGVAELLVNPVFHGWMRALRIVGYMQGWKTSHLHSKHLIQDEKCRICILGDHRWDPRNETEKAEQYFFSWESERVKRMLKPAEMKRFVTDEGRV